MAKFDLTNKNISDTFQNLLQKTGSQGRLYDLEGNLVTNLTIGGTLTAHSYVTSESIVNTSSGSTAFGNTADDSHTFIGNISASGTISASGIIYADGLQIGGGIGGAGLTATDIYASGNITASGNISASGDLYIGDIAQVQHITASGNISASGTIYAKEFKSSDADGDIDFSDSIDIAGNITASGAISSSSGISEFDKILTTGFRIRQPEIGTVHSVIIPHGDRAASGDITFTIPGDISASGTVYASTGSFGTTKTDVTIITETYYPASTFTGSIFISGSTPPIGTLEYASALTVLGDISASRNINASGLELNAVNATDDFFLLKSGSLDALKVNNEGVLQLGGFAIAPTAVSGGFYYNNEDDEFYLGKENN